MSWFGGGKQKDQVISVEAILCLDSLFHVPPPSSGKQNYYFVRLKSHDNNSKFAKDSTIACLSPSSQSIMVSWNEPIAFSCRLIQRSDDTFKPTIVRLSIRRSKNPSGQPFERFGYAHVDLGKFSQYLEFPQQIFKKHLLEQCKFNSIIKYSVELKASSSSYYSRSRSCSSEYLDLPRTGRMPRQQNTSRHRRASSISESSEDDNDNLNDNDNVNKDKVNIKRFESPSRDLLAEESRDSNSNVSRLSSNVSATFMDILCHYDHQQQQQPISEPQSQSQSQSVSESESVRVKSWKEKKVRRNRTRTSDAFLSLGTSGSGDVQSKMNIPKRRSAHLQSSELIQSIISSDCLSGEGKGEGEGEKVVLESSVI